MKHPHHKPHPHHSGRSLAGHIMRNNDMEPAGFAGPPSAEKADRMRMMAARAPEPPPEAAPPPTSAPPGGGGGFGMAPGPGGGPLPEEGP